MNSLRRLALGNKAPNIHKIYGFPTGLPSCTVHVPLMRTKTLVHSFLPRASVSCTGSVVTWLSAKERWVVGGAINSFDGFGWSKDAELAIEQRAW